MSPSPIKLGGCLLLAALGLAACEAREAQTPTAPTPPAAEAPAMTTVNSKDGAKIAYDRVGAGPPVILVNGALADRTAGAEIAKRLAPHFTVYTYDRRGRGGSGDPQPYAVTREIEDIDALIDQAGGTAHLVGFSSGAALALEAASALGPKVGKLAIYEPPYDEASGAVAKWQAYRKEQGDLLAAGRRGDAILHHMKFVGAPDPVVAQMKASPAWAGMEAMAHTLPYDVAVIGEDRTVPTTRTAKITAATLVMDGAASRQAMPFMSATADRIAKAVPGAQRRTLEGQAHNVSPDAVAPVLIEFFSAK